MQGTFMQVSILIPTFNRQKYLKRCVESIQKHTAEDYEIVFINTGTTKGGLKWLQSICRETANCHLIDTRGPGYADRVSQGLENSCGEYIVLLHNDVIVTGQWFDRMLDLLMTRSGIGCVGPMSNNVGGIQDIDHTEFLSDDQIDSFAHEFSLRNRHRRVTATELSGICVVSRRQTIEQIGGFDEQFATHDVMIEDLCLRSRLAGFKNTIAADVFIYHADKHKPLNPPDNSLHPMVEDRKAYHQKWNYLDPDNSTGKNALMLKALDKGVALNHSGRIRKAAEILSAGILYASQNRKLAFCMAEALTGVGDYRQALEILKNRLPSEKQDMRSLELMGYCHYGLERVEDAEKLAERLLSIKPASAPALNLKGLAALWRGDKKSAIHFYQKAFASDPGYGPAYTNLGILKQESDQIPEALELLEKGFILSAAEGNAAANFHSVITSLQAYDRAEMVFREAVGLYPQHKQLHYFLIDILLKSEKFESAMESIKQAIVRFGLDDGILDAALAIGPKVGPKTVNLADRKRGTVSLCMITKNEETHLARCLLSADVIVDEIIVVDTGSTDRTRDIATVFGARVDEFKWTDDFSAARNVSIAKASGDWIFVLDADEVLCSLNCTDFRKLISPSDANSVAYEFVTRNYTTKMNLIGWKPNDGLYPNEEAGCGWTASEKVRLFPNHPAIRFQYPVHELVEPSLEQKGVAVKRCHIPVHHYGKLIQKTTTAKKMPYYRLGKKKMVDMEGDAVSIRELAVQAAIVGNHHEAIDLWKRFISLQPNICDGYVNIGASYTQLGQYEAALTASQKALSLDPQRQEARYNYGISQLCLSNAGKAAEALELILQQHPDYLPAAFMLSAAYCCSGRKTKGMQGLAHLKKTAISPELSYRCLDLARCLILCRLMDYAILLLEVAIESCVVSADAHSLLSKINQLKKTAGETEISATAIG